MNTAGNEFLVGIRCATYNQSKYIKETLNGFAIQQTSFPYLVMVIDDASTDGEQDVISSYLTENFETEDNDIAYKRETEYAYIQFARHKTNRNHYMAVLFLKKNHYQKKLHDKKLEYLSQWRENIRYEALCEGDDYWTDPFKLQKQVDFLESHPDFSACCTNCDTYFQKDERKVVGHNRSGIIELNQLMYRNKIPTLTLMYRIDLFMKYHSEIVPEMPVWKMGDLPMCMYLALQGPIYRMKDYTGVYRILNNSASHHNDFIKQYDFMIEGFRIRLWFNEKFNLHYKPMLYLKLMSRTNKICRIRAQNGGGNYFSLLIKAFKNLHKNRIKR